MISYLKKRPHFLILILILLIGLFFRTFKIIERFEFAHDGDLYSWVVKDIVINHHPRLIGQLTSAPGIFIGPFFYYLLVPFFTLTKMDPIGVLIPTTLLGLFTIISYYFVLSKVFSKHVGLIGSYLYALLIVTVNSDRWVVPTIATNLWAIWYLYSIIMISRRRWSALLLSGFLIGLIWHVHIALIPALLSIPIALIFSKKIPPLKYLLTFIILILISSLPLLVFEVRHNFSQTLSFISNLSQPKTGIAPGFYKLKLVLEMITKNINSLFFSPQSFKLTDNIIFLFVILLSPFFILKKISLKIKELIILYSWIIGLILFFSLSNSLISEYYFSSIGVIFISFASLIFSCIFKSSRIGQFIVTLILGVALIKNAFFYITQNYYNKGYLERKGVVDFIATDAKFKGYKCFGISYISVPGENVGFRYFFFLKNAHLIHPSLDVPVYNIIIPEEIVNEEKHKFGHIGVTTPAIKPYPPLDQKCLGENTNLTDPMFGYVE